MALVRPPEQTLMDAATGVSLSFPTEKLCIVRAWRSKVNVAINDWSGHVIRAQERDESGAHTVIGWRC